jgi:hypothetical protein
MTEPVDQQICIKFCLELGHSSAETNGMIKKVFGDDSVSEAQINCGTDASNMAWNLFKVIHVLEGLQQAEHLKMLNMCWLQSTKIGD